MNWSDNFDARVWLVMKVTLSWCEWDLFVKYNHCEIFYYAMKSVFRCGQFFFSSQVCLLLRFFVLWAFTSSPFVNYNLTNVAKCKYVIVVILFIFYEHLMHFYPQLDSIHEAKTSWINHVRALKSSCWMGKKVFPAIVYADFANYFLNRNWKHLYQKKKKIYIYSFMFSSAGTIYWDSIEAAR